MFNSVCDKNQQQAQQKVADFISRKDEEALEFILGAQEGRWFLMCLLDKCKMLAGSSTADATGILIQEGKRRIGVDIINEIERLGIEGLKSKQQAEIEYAQTMESLRKWRKDAR